MRKRAAQAVKKNKPMLFHWRGGYLTKEVLKELIEVITEEAKNKDKNALISVNWPQAVLKVRFEKDVVKEVEMEDALISVEE